jgi:hypothetical protein
MTKSQMIDSIFNILVQYEKVYDNNSKVQLIDYLNYIDRLYTFFNGYNSEIAIMLKGIYNLKEQNEHDSVKRAVFHMISLLQKEE